MRNREFSKARLLATLVAAACVFPFAVLALLSVAEQWAFPDPLPPSWRPERWLTVGGGLFARSVGLSLAVSAAVATLSTAAGYVTGKYVAGHRHGRALLFLAYVPFAMSPVVLGVCLLFLYLKLGLVGTALGVVLAQTIFAYGFAIVLFSAFWTPELRALEDLVRTLGGGTWAVYREALLPASRGALALCFFQTFLLSWFQYGLTVLIGAGRVQTLPVQVFAFVNEADPYLAALASCLLVGPPLVLMWVNKRFLFAPDSEDPAPVTHL
jgi:putative spermidine/putrescine transport system permease protein